MTGSRESGSGGRRFVAQPQCHSCPLNDWPERGGIVGGLPPGDGLRDAYMKRRDSQERGGGAGREERGG